MGRRVKGIANSNITCFWVRDNSSDRRKYRLRKLEKNSLKLVVIVKVMEPNLDTRTEISVIFTISSYPDLRRCSGQLI